MSEQRNVVLVTVDSLRADHCGCYGHDGGLTPTLDQMANKGLTFENAIAPAPATLGSVPPIFTGEYRSAHEPLSSQDSIQEHISTKETIPEKFSDAGYNTIGITTNPWTSRYFQFDTGFDYFEDFLSEADETEDRGLGDGSGLLSQARNWWEGQEMFMSWESIYDDILEAQQTADEPYFMWLFLVDPHMPYLPGDGYRTQSQLLTYLANLWLYAGQDNFLEDQARSVLLEAYRNTIRYTDAFLENLLEDLGDDPLVVVHGDHGEEFGEHGYYGHGPHLREENIHVPLVVANGPTGRVENPFSLRDLPQFLYDLATTNTVTIPEQSYVKSKNKDPKWAIRGLGWKYVRTPESESLYAIDGNTETPLDNSELSALGEEIVKRWRADQEERDAVVMAARELSESEAV